VGTVHVPFSVWSEGDHYDHFVAREIMMAFLFHDPSKLKHVLFLPQVFAYIASVIDFCCDMLFEIFMEMD
jgi:hypothetical protein